MELFIPSFLAGVLTVLAPCVLSLLPIIIGGSVGEKNPLRPLIIVGSLGISVIIFTLLLKATTALIGIPQEFWKFISGGLITIFGLVMMFPDQWTQISCKLKLYKSEAGLAQSGKISGNKGAILLGASLGPVFTTCSPTYLLILAIVLPKSLGLTVLNLTIYAVGMSIPLLAIGYGGRKIASKFKGASNPKGWLKRVLAIILILTGIAIVTGFDKKIESALIERGYRGAFELEQSIANQTVKPKTESMTVKETALQKYNLETNTAKPAEDFDIKKIVSGGTGTDGIPTINSPIFSPLSEVQTNNPNLKDDQLGIVVSHGEETRFYPYNILVWHEIVNDVIADIPIAVTFCPLCGSAIVYERNLSGDTIQFGVSGLLYESNLLMYDTKTESLWSQIEGRSVVGDLADTELVRFPMQVMSFEEAKQKYPDMEVLSEQTGYTRQYNIYPYGEYDTNDDLYFNVTYTGKEYDLPLKEIVYATTYQDTPIAFVRRELAKIKTATVTMENGTQITAQYQDEEITLKTDSGEELVGYNAQWFSWANHNLEQGVGSKKNGIVWNGNQEF